VILKHNSNKGNLPSMDNIKQKAGFLSSGFTKELSKLDEDTPRKWGKMNVWQMVEHMSDSIKIANGKTPIEIVTPEDNIPRMQSFLESEKPFKENTPNVLLPDVPPPVRNATLPDAINELQNEIDHFFEVYEADERKTIANPFFGQLNFEQQVQLLHKHATHHLRQFGATV
jgi:hypothetical protein